MEGGLPGQGNRAGLAGRASRGGQHWPWQGTACGRRASRSAQLCWAAGRIRSGGAPVARTRPGQPLADRAVDERLRPGVGMARVGGSTKQNSSADTKHAGKPGSGRISHQLHSTTSAPLKLRSSAPSVRSIGCPTVAGPSNRGWWVGRGHHGQPLGDLRPAGPKQRRAGKAGHAGVWCSHGKWRFADLQRGPRGGRVLQRAPSPAVSSSEGSTPQPVRSAGRQAELPIASLPHRPRKGRPRTPRADRRELHRRWPGPVAGVWQRRPRDRCQCLRAAPHKCAGQTC